MWPRKKIIRSFPIVIFNTCFCLCSVAVRYQQDRDYASLDTDNQQKRANDAAYYLTKVLLPTCNSLLELAHEMFMYKPVGKSLINCGSYAINQLQYFTPAI